jgi:DNA repair protein RecN (Recombination protein N)
VLYELRIENLLLIERAELRFEAGLNAITGETGAGKTILAHSLDLLMGGRARPQIVRPGAKEAFVEGTFAVPDGLLDDPDLAELAERLPEDAAEIVLARRISASGRTSAFVDGRSAPVGDLRALGGRLLAFYGQHEHRKLALASAQLDILDGFAGAEHLDRRGLYRAAHAEAGRIERELAELREREGNRERDLDLLRFELAEIEAAADDLAQEESLRAERDRLRHAESLQAAAGGALSAVAGEEDAGSGASAVSLGANAEASLGAVAGVDRDLDEIAERVTAVGLELSDLGSSLRNYLESIEAEPGRLEEVEERLGALDRLARKHGGSAESVLAHRDHLETEIAELENAGEHAAELERAVVAAVARRTELASDLSVARTKAAKRLEKAVQGELAELAMDGATLEVTLEPEPGGHGPSGAERVELMVATNPGMPTTPLRETASGGELSRVMLALSTLASPRDEGEEATIVFDEIDAGIGGKAARAVGERLRALGAARQVICITHLPQVASFAANHFTIAKHVEKGQTAATVDRVEGEELVAEICRMLGADRGDQAAEQHARELLAAA